MEAEEKMVLAGILRRDREGGIGAGICMLKRGMHATFKCPHADEKKEHWHLFSKAQKAKLCKLSPPLHVYFPLEY